MSTMVYSRSVAVVLVAACAALAGCSSSDSAPEGAAGSAGTGGGAGSGGTGGTGGSGGTGGTGGTGGSADDGGGDATTDAPGEASSDAASDAPANPAVCVGLPTPTGACDGFLTGTVRMCTEYYETSVFPIANQRSACGSGTFTEGGTCPTAGTIGHCLVTLDYPGNPYATKSLFYYDSACYSTFKDSCAQPGAAGSTKSWCEP